MTALQSSVPPAYWPHFLLLPATIDALTTTPAMMMAPAITKVRPKGIRSAPVPLKSAAIIPPTKQPVSSGVSFHITWRIFRRIVLETQIAASCRSSALATATSRRAMTNILAVQHGLCLGIVLAASCFAFLSKLESLTLPDMRRGSTGPVQRAPVTNCSKNGGSWGTRVVRPTSCGHNLKRR